MLLFLFLLHAANCLSFPQRDPVVALQDKSMLDMEPERLQEMQPSLSQHASAEDQKELRRSHQTWEQIIR